MTIDWLLEKPENFETLRGCLITYPNGHKYIGYHGFITAALLDWEKEVIDGKEYDITILAVNTKECWLTYRRTRQDLLEMLTGANITPNDATKEEDCFNL